MADVKSEIEKTGENTVRLKIAVPAEAVAAALDAEYRRYAREVSMPGFRKGKVPRRVIEKRYGKSILDDVVGDTVAESLDETIKGNELDVIGTPAVKVEPYDGTGDLVYSAEVDVYPEFELPKVGSILSKIKVRKPKVTDKDVDAALENLRAANATLEPITDRPSEDGDMVILRFLAETPPGFEKDVIRIWANKNPDDFAGRQALGHMTGDTFSLVIKYPDDFGDKTAAGTERNEPVEVIEVKTPVPPELDDDFAADLDFDDLGALREDVRGKLLTRDAAKARTEAFDELVSRVAAKVEIPMSETFVEKATADAHGATSLDEIEGVSKNEALKTTRENLSRYMFVHRMAEEKGIKPTPEDVESLRRSILETEGFRISYPAALDYILKTKLTELLFGESAGPAEKQSEDVATVAASGETEK
jgi:trigger factor